MPEQFFINRGSDTELLLKLSGALLLIFLAIFLLDFKIPLRHLPIDQDIAYTPFPQVAIKAKAAYVYDVRTQTVLFAKNEDEKLPLASLTKIMSALVARDLSPLYGTIKISSEALAADGDSGLLRDEEWSLKNILDFSLVASSNDGMRAVALSLGALSRSSTSPEKIVSDFVYQMNKKARELGLTNTYFWNETGLDLATAASVPQVSDVGAIQEGAYGSAKDMILLVEYVLATYPDMLESTRESQQVFYSYDNHSHLARNTNVLVGEIPGILASKTGFTAAAGGNLVVAFDPELGRPIIISVLGSTEQGRFEDMKKLVQATLSYINKNQ